MYQQPRYFVSSLADINLTLEAMNLHVLTLKEIDTRGGY